MSTDTPISEREARERGLTARTARVQREREQREKPTTPRVQMSRRVQTNEEAKR